MEERKLLTLCILHEPSRVLLGMKKRGFGQGRWNGFGGKVEEDETIEDAAMREVKEESGIVVKKIEKHGIIEFRFENNQEILEVHIFRINEFEGEISETEEMRPNWFPVGKIPFEEMWEDDKYWFPLFLEKKKFKGNFLFDKDDKILNSNLIEVKNI
ncbi:8-oxo-dGTP diphosphatase [archaeon]|jgi:8-oxo-dGTP diphosphatase / 2-hydroxy-dATP diphosphatase|nr:8-oxo-dGTP diphosphatase [archaeon]